MPKTFNNDETCPRCRESTLESWDELSDDEQFIVRRLPGSAEYSLETRKKHRFCTRCWFEETTAKDQVV